MGGLGNGRRGGRSPPLMIGALIALILVLGFNYWVSSSRNLELQSQVRRGAAERGAAEQRETGFQEEIQRQKEQISRIESLFKRQLEGAQNTCSQERGTLQLNISTSTKTIQDLKGHLNQLNDDLGKVQKEMQSCQGNLNTLNKKLTYDMTQCNTQILSQKELCDERVAAAKLDVQRKMEKLIPVVSSQVNTAPTLKREGPVKEDRLDKAGPLDDTKTTPVLGHTLDRSQPKANDMPELLTNEIMVDKGLDAPAVVPSLKDLSKSQAEPLSLDAATKEDVLPPPDGAEEKEADDTATAKLQKKNLTEDKEMEVMAVHEEEDSQIEEADAGVEDMLIGQGKADGTPVGQRIDDAENYDAEEQIVGGVDLEKPQNQLAENIDKTMEDELADYNGDNENEGEFEADKQAELAEN